MFCVIFYVSFVCHVHELCYGCVMLWVSCQGVMICVCHILYAMCVLCHVVCIICHGMYHSVCYDICHITSVRCVMRMSIMSICHESCKKNGGRGYFHTSCYWVCWAKKGPFLRTFP